MGLFDYLNKIADVIADSIDGSKSPKTSKSKGNKVIAFQTEKSKAQTPEEIKEKEERERKERERKKRIEERERIEERRLQLVKQKEENFKNNPIEHRCPLCGGYGGKITHHPGGIGLTEYYYIKDCENLECRNGYVDIQKPPEMIIYRCSNCGKNNIGSSLCVECRFKMEQSFQRAEQEKQREFEKEQREESLRLQFAQLKLQYEQLCQNGRYLDAQIVFQRIQQW